jgi:mRNA interferase MazF
VTQANSVGLKPTNGHSPVAMSNGKIENNFFQRAKSKVYGVNLDPTMGAEINKTRPCVMISPDSANRAGSLILVAPITKSEGENIYFYEISLPTSIAGLSYPSKVYVFQIRYIDKKRLREPKIGSLPTEQISLLNEKIRIVTGIY